MYSFRYTRNSIAVMVLVFSFIFANPVFADYIIADHQSSALFSEVHDTIIEDVKQECNIVYGCSSHGYQVISGMDILKAEDDLYNYNSGTGTLSIRQISMDLGHNGDTAWAAYTRQVLNEPGNDYNIVMWAWCAGVSDNTEEGINVYLSKMEELEADYPHVTFVYMTGHLDGSGPAGNLNILNNQIRSYCITNQKALYDFADIESYDPDGNYYPDETDYCYWCYTWCASNPCPSCFYCAHTHCFNCYQKGQAFWWMLAKFVGWEPEHAGCGDSNSDSVVNVSDAIFIVNYIFVGGSIPDPRENGDTNCDDKINVSDAVWIINYVFVGGNSPCDLDDDDVPDC